MHACRFLMPAVIAGSCISLAAAQPPTRFERPAPPPDRLFIAEVPDPFTVQFIADEDEPQETGAAWIGVQLGPVPSALASHLGLGDKGLVVRNVFKDSPADQAGIQRHDVLVQANDVDVVGTVQDFSRTIRRHKVGDRLRLTLIRGGKELRQEITLGEAPPPHELTPKFPEEPDVLYRRDFGLRGRIFRPGPDGWIMEDLGVLPDLERMLRERARNFNLDGLRRNRDARGESVDHARRIGKNGEMLSVRRGKDGTIEVRREQRPTTGPAGETGPARSEVSVYTNMDALRKGDPEAAELLDRAQPEREREQPDAADRRPERRRVPAPSDERWREWRERFFQPFERPVPPPSFDDPAVRFEAHPDGSVTVHKRMRDRELSVTYVHRDEFKARAPELYKDFLRMESSLK